MAPRMAAQTPNSSIPSKKISRLGFKELLQIFDSKNLSFRIPHGSSNCPCKVPLKASRSMLAAREWRMTHQCKGFGKQARNCSGSISSLPLESEKVQNTAQQNPDVLKPTDYDWQDLTRIFEVYEDDEVLELQQNPALSTSECADHNLKKQFKELQISESPEEPFSGDHVDEDHKVVKESEEVQESEHLEKFESTEDPEAPSLFCDFSSPPTPEDPVVIEEPYDLEVDIFEDNNNFIPLDFNELRIILEKWQDGFN